MASDNFSSMKTNSKNLVVSIAIFFWLVVLSIFLVWMFSPSPVIFSEPFDNNERNQQYLPCDAFKIVDEKLRVTVTEPHSGCAVRLPNEYENFTFTATVLPVGDVHDASINLLLRQESGGWYEIQFRPEVKQVNFISFAIDSNGKPYADSTTNWQSTPDAVLRNTRNTIKVTVTEQWMGFSFNDAPLFKATSVSKFPFDHGFISIGVGAGDVGNIAFEFDNLEIREEKLFFRWWKDFLVLQETKQSVSPADDIGQDT